MVGCYLPAFQAVRFDLLGSAGDSGFWLGPQVREQVGDFLKREGVEQFCRHRRLLTRFQGLNLTFWDRNFLAIGLQDNPFFSRSWHDQSAIAATIGGYDLL